MYLPIETMKKTQMGSKGEDLAVQYLVAEGYSIQARNWRSGHKEIDIIAVKDDLVVFVEVKYRSSTRHGHPEEFVDARKQAHLIQAATSWLTESGHEQEIRFDIIAIHGNPDQENNLIHIPDAFFPFYG